VIFFEFFNNAICGFYCVAKVLCVLCDVMGVTSAAGADVTAVTYAVVVAITGGAGQIGSAGFYTPDYIRNGFP
jgi:hypothetical protein